LRGVLLCEDREHERFFRSHLLKKWFGRGKLYVNLIPNNQGAGDAWVLKQYAKEVQEARRKKTENYALVVAVDGDRFKLKERLRQLDQKLTEGDLPTREKSERIVVFVPTRSIETWELWLCGDRNVDEDSDLKQRFREAEKRGEASAKNAATAWFQSPSTEDRTIEKRKLPSLAAGRIEIRRLDR
jgi:hypothetical protein